VKSVLENNKRRIVSFPILPILMYLFFFFSFQSYIFDIEHEQVLHKKERKEDKMGDI